MKNCAIMLITMTCAMRWSLSFTRSIEGGKDGKANWRAGERVEE